MGEISKPRVRVVIVTYNAARIIRDCLFSLVVDYQSNLIEVVVADNNSSDDTLNFINKEYSWVKVVNSGGNIGFGAGNNIGVKGCQAEYLYFLNSDARSLPGSIEYLVRLLDGDSKVGIVGPKILDEAGLNTLSSYRFITPFYAVWIATGLNRLIPLNRRDGRPEIRRKPPEKRVSVDRLLGAAFMMRTELFEKLGGFDENYFLYSEEEDICLETWKAGYEVVYDPGAEAIHLGGQTLNSLSILGTASASWSLKYYLTKHFNPISSKVAIFIWMVMLAVKWFITLVIPGANKRTRLKGYMSALLSVMSPDYYNDKIRPK